MKGVRNIRRRIRCDTGVHAVPIVKSFRKRVNAAELQAVPDPAMEVNFEPVIRTYAFRKPMRCVPYGIVGQRRIGWIVIRTGGVIRRAGRGGADRWYWQVRIDGKQSVISVRADVADRQGGGRRKLLLDLEGPGFDGGSLQVRLHPAREYFCARVGGVGRSESTMREIARCVVRAMGFVPNDLG